MSNTENTAPDFTEILAVLNGDRRYTAAVSKWGNVVICSRKSGNSLGLISKFSVGWRVQGRSKPTTRVLKSLVGDLVAAL